MGVFAEGALDFVLPLERTLPRSSPSAWRRVSVKARSRFGADEDRRRSFDIGQISVYHTHVRSSAIIRRLKQDGWYVCNIRGSHHQFKHPTKPGKITVPHPRSELPFGTARAIFRQAGIVWPG